VLGGLVAVLKFGSSILRTEEDLPRVVEEIRFWTKGGARVVAVVSAFGNTTEALFDLGRKYGDGSNEEAMAALVVTGEQAAAGLLALALASAGVRSRLLDPVEIRLRAAGVPLDARLCGVNAEEIRRALAECPAVVIPGFIGRTARGSLALLGRGGSDLTALFLAGALGADRCRLVKDVDGIYASDRKASPEATHGAVPNRYEHLDWEEALGLDGGVVQPKALRFAAENRVSVEVAALGRARGTTVGKTRGGF